MYGWCKLSSCTELFLIDLILLNRCGVYSTASFARINTVSVCLLKIKSKTSI